jgi:pimeloyl-ACP methyl ester carboxylesterase
VPFLFFHGFGSSRVVRHPEDSIAAALGIRILAVDRPGIGLSSGQPGRRLLSWPRDVEQLADALGLERFGVLGWSGGGPYALACGWALPSRVLVAGLVSAPAPLSGAGAGSYTLARTHRVAARTADHAPWMIRLAMWRWSRAQRNDPEGRLEEAIEGMVEADRAVLEDPRLRAVMLANTEEIHRQGGRGLYDEALIMARPWGFPLEGLPIAVRIWHGEEDNTVPVGMGRHLAHVIPGSRATFYPGEGHHLVYDRWAEILTELRIHAVRSWRVPLHHPRGAPEGERRSPQAEQDQHRVRDTPDADRVDDRDLQPRQVRQARHARQAEGVGDQERPPVRSEPPDR